MEKKVYSSYAFAENEREKSRINIEIYKELNGVHKVTIYNMRMITD